MCGLHFDCKPDWASRCGWDVEHRYFKRKGGEFVKIWSKVSLCLLFAADDLKVCKGGLFKLGAYTNGADSEGVMVNEGLI